VSYTLSSSSLTGLDLLPKDGHLTSGKDARRCIPVYSLYTYCTFCMTYTPTLFEKHKQNVVSSHMAILPGISTTYSCVKKHTEKPLFYIVASIQSAFPLFSPSIVLSQVQPNTSNIFYPTFALCPCQLNCSNFFFFFFSTTPPPVDREGIVTGTLHE
jgi:hypothetical protein